MQCRAWGQHPHTPAPHTHPYTYPLAPPCAPARLLTPLLPPPCAPRYSEAAQAYHAALERCGGLERADLQGGDKHGLEERSEGRADACAESARMYCDLLCELAEVYSRYEVPPPPGVTPAALLRTALEVARALQPGGDAEGGGTRRPTVQSYSRCAERNY